MAKTKLGISVGLLGAGIYFLGLLGILPAVLLAGYALISEQDEWLKKTAVKAIAVMLFFAVLLAIIAVFNHLWGVLVDFVRIVYSRFSVTAIDWILSSSHRILQTIGLSVYIFLGIRALHGKSIPLGPLDKLIDKHMQ